MSKTTYIYLNTYKIKGNFYYYVGSHTWSGPPGLLDPSYHGSGLPTLHYHWTPIKEEILEVVDNKRKLVAERFWIEKYASIYGIADCATILDRGRNKHWWGRFKQHGKLMNLQASCLPPHSGTEASSAKIRKFGMTKKQLQAVRENVKLATISAAQKALSYGPSEKQTQVRKRNIKATHNPLAVGKRVKSHNYSTKHNTRGCLGRYSCVVNGIKYSSIRQACTSIGHANWHATVALNLRKAGFYERGSWRFSYE